MSEFLLVLMVVSQSQSLVGGGGTLSDDHVFEEEEDPCLICMDELSADAMTRLGCSHRFHTEVRIIK